MTDREQDLLAARAFGYDLRPGVWEILDDAERDAAALKAYLADVEAAKQGQGPLYQGRTRRLSADQGGSFIRPQSEGESGESAGPPVGRGGSISEEIRDEHRRRSDWQSDIWTK